MNSYLLYKDKAYRQFRSLINSAPGVFEKYKIQAQSYLKYANGDLDKVFQSAGEVLDFASIDLSTKVPTAFKPIFKPQGMKDSYLYLKNLFTRIDEFKGNPDALKVCVGVHFLKFVVVSKIVETYVNALVSFKKLYPNKDMSLSDIGLGRSVLTFFEPLLELDSKTIDEWLAYKPDAVETKYYMSAMKRIMTILIGDERGV